MNLGSLDRVILWFSLFPAIDPILILSSFPETKKDGSTVEKKNRLYKCKRLWYKEEECGIIINHSWVATGDVLSNIKHTSSNLEEWGRSKFENMKKDIKKDIGACCNS